MIKIKNVTTHLGQKINHQIDGEDRVIEAEGLVMLPALIDPHVHFRVPGAEYKEDWESGALAAICGGVTTVFDMPNNTPSCISKKRLAEKKAIIEKQLKIPLRYGLYLGADQNHLDEIAKTKDQIVGLKIYMGSSTGDLLMNDPKALEKAFRLAAENSVLVAVHAEDEDLIKKRSAECKAALQTDPKSHSMIRSPEVAQKALAVALELAEKYKTRLYVAHVSTKEELDLIRKAKMKGVQVFAEATPHHLFLTTALYEKLGTRALVNPPLRDHVDALWQAIKDQTIDTIGTDHAPHLLEEKMRPMGSAPSGFASIELYLALLLNAHHEKKISLEQIVSLTSTQPREIFHWPVNSDVVLVDLNHEQVVKDSHLKTKAKWSPYAGMKLKGWPRYTILKGKVYDTQMVP
ncbi:MAG: dihydroorotase [Chlamydiae bacterium CG10_big_fil_rev_8_21_14_0_10_42_34]|nr:MAG: dihydroorotase [Chlamydiae bacterium CG10_big_fil_rev_8_21_14_0_10_42_34]